MPKILIDFKHPRGTVKAVTLENGEQWTLEGECNRCGDCCLELNMSVKEHRGPDGKCNKFSFETVNGETLGNCSIIHGRPAFCVFYPRDPYDPLYKNCSFKWDRVR